MSHSRVHAPIIIAIGMEPLGLTQFCRSFPGVTLLTHTTSQWNADFPAELASWTGVLSLDDLLAACDEFFDGSGRVLAIDDLDGLLPDTRLWSEDPQRYSVLQSVLQRAREHSRTIILTLRINPDSVGAIRVINDMEPKVDLILSCKDDGALGYQLNVLHSLLPGLNQGVSVFEPTWDALAKHATMTTL